MPYEYLKITQGWMDYQEIYEMAVDLYDNCTFVEIGSFMGRSACYMAELIKEKQKNIKLVCVDLFPTKTELVLYENIGAGQGEEHHIISSMEISHIDKFVSNMRLANVYDYVIPVKSDSHKAASLFNDNFLPFVFLDACHGYEGVKKDLKLWWPKVKEGGIMAGHDYEINSSAGVNMAVDEFALSLGRAVEASKNSWLLRK